MSSKFKGQVLRRVVIKIGSSLLIKDGELNRGLIRSLVKQMVGLKAKGLELAVVSSGAVGYGAQILGRDRRRLSLPESQAAAAVGQGHLMHVYDNIFRKNQLMTAQVLLTREDFSQRLRYLNASNTLSTLLKENVIPIVNENDTVAVDEICFGDNDTLAALVTNLVGADLLIVLTEIDGLYDYESGERVKHVETIDAKITRLIRSETSSLGTGGMETKIEAARMVTQAGESMVIAGGRMRNVLTRLLDGEDLGTYFVPRVQRMSGRKRWIAFSSKARGQVEVDAGAGDALLKRGRSLLASGVVLVTASFGPGDVVDIVCDNQVIARGLSNLSSEDIEAVKGCKTSEMKARLGAHMYEEVIHRNNLVLVRVNKD